MIAAASIPCRSPSFAPVHLAGLYIYGEGVTEGSRQGQGALAASRAEQFASILYLLDKNALPQHLRRLSQNRSRRAGRGRQKPPDDPPSGPDAAWTMTPSSGSWGASCSGCAVVVALFVGGVGLFRYIRRKQGHKDDASLYRTVFAVYDVIHGVSRASAWWRKA